MARHQSWFHLGKFETNDTWFARRPLICKPHRILVSMEKFKVPPIGVELCRAERRMAPLCPPSLSSHRPGWCQISCLARTMLLGNLLLCAEARLPAQASIKKWVLASEIPSSVPLLPSWPRAASLWSEYNDTPDPDVSAAETQFRRNIREDAAWKPDGATPFQSYSSNLCDAHSRHCDGTIHSWESDVR